MFLQSIFYEINIYISTHFPFHSWPCSQPPCSCLSCYYYMKGFMKISAIRLISGLSESHRRRLSPLFTPLLPARFAPSHSDVLFPCKTSCCRRCRASRRPSEKMIACSLTSEGESERSSWSTNERGGGKWNPQSQGMDLAELWCLFSYNFIITGLNLLLKCLWTSWFMFHPNSLE